MNKRTQIKIFKTCLWLVAIVGLSASLGFVARSEENIIASDLDISIVNNDENAFLTENEVRGFFTDREKTILSKKYKSISIPELERVLNSHPAIENAEVAADMNGQIRVNVLQRTPVLRVINKNGESYYIDSQSRLMPLNDNYSARVPVANGEIFEPYARRYQYSVDQISKNKLFSEVSILDDLKLVSDHIRRDSVLSDLIHQIYVNKDQEFELFPSVGKHRIIFGTAENAEMKFNKLKLFYTEGLNKSDGWMKYSTINLKYKNLVVCTKK